jgi:uncharacterized protein YfaP (DUF2135 family)
MADCLAQLDRADLAMIYYEIALHGRWNSRYGDVSEIATVHYVHLLERIVASELPTSAESYARTRLATLQGAARAQGSDLVVSMAWNTDRTDVDLHIREPSGEVCFYQNRDTRAGGHLTRDVTEGFGPEMYNLPRAAKGNYQILADYYSTDANRTGARTRVYLIVHEMLGHKTERVTRHAVLLKNQKEKQLVGVVDLRNKSRGQAAQESNPPE